MRQFELFTDDRNEGYASNPQIVYPPTSAPEIAAWFSEAVRSEIEELSKKGQIQQHELLSGQLLQESRSRCFVFSFLLADGARVPEDSSGKLSFEGGVYPARVLSQEADRIQIEVELRPPAQAPHAIHRAMLAIDDTALLRVLAEVLDQVAQKVVPIGPSAVEVFHPVQARVGKQTLPQIAELGFLTGEHREACEKACGSSLTYIWGPPGTGKTFTIAHLIAALVPLGERVLVLSHTNAAVDQTLYECIKHASPDDDERCPGPLAEHPLITQGKIVRVGRTVSEKIDSRVQLDWILEQESAAIQSEILTLESSAKPLRHQREYGSDILAQWDRLHELTERHAAAVQSCQLCEQLAAAAHQRVKQRQESLLRRQASLQAATRAWFFRTKRISTATAAAHLAQQLLDEARSEFESCLHSAREASSVAATVGTELEKQRERCEGLPPRDSLMTELARINELLHPIETKILCLTDGLSQIERKVISEARAVFCTLTKNYTGKSLEGQSFDAVIIDEISIALPPLIFLAAGRATNRVILLGDFCQLPPIVRSDTPMSNERLANSTFVLSGVVKNGKPAPGCSALSQLACQRRMLPEIADCARYLIYNRAQLNLKDHDSVKERRTKIEQGRQDAWLRSLPGGPLLIVDTADLHCWSGKQPGSLSRFNVYSATVAVEIAALAASNLERPVTTSARPIGIVTPFAAQRRLVRTLITDLALDRWVAAGTIHTFQGSEADLIIFDSVLDEPYWSARLCNPRDQGDVLRELNVALTRARNRLVFVGSSEWLNKHAKPGSGLGRLWAYLKEHSDLVSALELPISGVPRTSSSESGHSPRWSVPPRAAGLCWEPLDEAHFFQRFVEDIDSASQSIFAFAPQFGSFRWPIVQPAFYRALKRTPPVQVTIITQPPHELEPAAGAYARKALRNLEDLGAVVVPASGIHGKDVIIDERILYTGSMNWSSHRGRLETGHRFEAPGFVKAYLELLQAKYIRQAVVLADGSPRVCPHCKGSTWVVNLRKQPPQWDKQALKVGCLENRTGACPGFLRDIDERPPFPEAPTCQLDGRTKYRRVRSGKGEQWQCPKHPKGCERFKVVPGDP